MQRSGVYISIKTYVVITLEGFSSPDVERNPELDLWVSGHPQTQRTVAASRLEAQRYRRPKPSAPPLEEEEQEKGTDGEGKLPPRSKEMMVQMEGELLRTELPHDTYLEMDLWLYAKNDSGVWCRMGAGSAHVSLQEILMKSAQASHTHVVDVDIPKARNLHKATVYLRVERRAAFVTGPVHFMPPRGDERGAIDAYLQRCGDTLPGVQLYARNEVIANTKLAYWQTRAGLLPPEMYWVDPLLPGVQSRPSLELYQVMMRYVLQVNDWREEELVYVARAQMSAQQRGVPGSYNPQFTRVCVVLAEMLSFYSNCCPYVGDFVHPSANGPGGWDPRREVMIESFDDLFRRLSGDCEDLARATGLMMLWLRSYAGETNEQQHGLLHYLVETLELYVDFGTLGNVTSAALGQREDETKWGAHMFGVFVSSVTFLEMCGRANDPATLQLLASSMKFQRQGEWTRSLPVLVLEGTGRMNPILRPCTDYFPRDRGEADRRVARHRALENLRTHMSVQTFATLSSYMEQTRVEPYNVGDAAQGKHLYRFYRTFNQGYTAYWLRHGVPHGRFVFLDLSQRGRLVYSVRIEDVLYGQKHVAVRFTERMDSACYEQSMHVIRWHLNPVPVPKFSQHIPRLGCELRALKTLEFSHKQRETELTRENIAARRVHVDTFVNPEELTPEYLRHLQNDISSSGHSAGVVAVQCTPMPVAGNVGTVCIRFVCLV